MIDLVTFKKDIENNTLPLDNKLLIICKGKDISSEFIFTQYVKTFAKNNNLNIIITEHAIGSIFGFDKENLYTVKTDKLENNDINFNSLIYYKSISKNIKSQFYSNIVELPKLEKWQILDYISTKSNIELKQAELLYKEYSDIYKLDIESKKLNIFGVNQFDNIVDQLIFNSEYKLFDLTNAILQRDINKISLIYKTNLEVDVFALLSILIKNFKLVIDIQLAKNASAESLGISGKQFWAIKNFNCNRYSREELIYIYKLLTSIDLYIKTGYMNTDIVKDYIIFKILAL